LLDQKESPWDFEKNAALRSANLLFLSVKNDPVGHIRDQTYPITYYYLTAVYKGKWLWEIVRICKKEGLTLDLHYRKSQTYIEMLYQRLYHASPVLMRKWLDYLFFKPADARS
jgi:hypothetical protein